MLILESETYRNKPSHRIPIPQKINSKNSSNLNWTDDDSPLVEVCYGFKEMKVINNGKVSIKEIAEALGNAFNIDLSKYVQSWKHIKKRKRDPLFLEVMSNRLKQFILTKSK